MVFFLTLVRAVEAVFVGVACSHNMGVWFFEGTLFGVDLREAKGRLRSRIWDKPILLRCGVAAAPSLGGVSSNSNFESPLTCSA